MHRFALVTGLALWASSAFAAEMRERSLGRVKLVQREFRPTASDVDACLADIKSKTRPQAVFKCLFRAPGARAAFIFNSAYQTIDGDPRMGMSFQVNPDGYSVQFRGKPIRDRATGAAGVQLVTPAAAYKEFERLKTPRTMERWTQPILLLTIE